MATYNETSVTVSRSHFDLLVRRAQFNAETFDTTAQSTTVAVSQDEYDQLKLIAQQYANLRQNLLRGGTDEATLALLSQDLSDLQNNDPESPVAQFTKKADRDPQGGARLTLPSPHVPPPTYNGAPSRLNSNGFAPFHNRSGGGRWADDNHDSFETDGGVDDTDLDGPTDGPHGQQQNDQHGPPRPQFDRDCTRSVHLWGLPEGATHADVTDVVRGGPLLDVHLRSHERSCIVSFLRAVDARAFFDHVKKNDLYLKQKRIEIRWAQKQFTLPGHVASKIGIGATRNLIIRRVDPRLNEEAIRDDLEHIHNLTVIKVEFRGSSCYIRTNAVHNAMFARTCMMSRLKYKGSKIDWDVDECAQPLAMVAPARTLLDTQPVKKPTKATNNMVNRFHLLNMDDEDEDEDISPTFQRGHIGVTA